MEGGVAEVGEVTSGVEIVGETVRVCVERAMTESGMLIEGRLLPWRVRENILANK